jgi:hypothetical protein
MKTIPYTKLKRAKKYFFLLACCVILLAPGARAEGRNAEKKPSFGSALKKGAKSS